MLKNIWKRAINELEPQVVIDVGVNYGEFLFAERYPSAERVIGIEANADLAPFLERSRNEHKDKSKIELHYALASNASNEKRQFFVDESSSGRSSVICRDSTTCRELEIRTVAIDDLIADLCIPCETLVFKIDVEGFEPQVLLGMVSTLRKYRNIFGIIEFNEQLIDQAGSDPEQFLRMLAQTFSLWSIPHHAPIQRMKSANLLQLRQYSGTAIAELDIVVASADLEPFGNKLFGTRT